MSNNPASKSIFPTSHFPGPLTTEEKEAACDLIEMALKEDLGERGDITSQLLIPEAATGRVAIVARKTGVSCGLAISELIIACFDDRCQLLDPLPDGSLVSPGQTLALLDGPLRSLLTMERTILNFLTHLSGISSLTRRYVEQTQNTQAQILDTRKTHPGYRLLEKYAVRCGGGTNHRMGLYDGMMIKDNHLAARRRDYPHESATEMIRVLKQAHPSLPLTVEVDNLDQLEQLLPGNPDIILLDNMSTEQMKLGVELRDQLSPSTLLEASGGVNLETVRQIAESGVDRISVGALTHSAPAFDIGFDWTN